MFSLGHATVVFVVSAIVAGTAVALVHRAYFKEPQRRYQEHSSRDGNLLRGTLAEAMDVTSLPARKQLSQRASPATKAAAIRQ